MLSLFGAAACGGTPTQANTDAPGPSSADAPRFLTFGTNVTSLTEGQAVTFTAVLTDPNGIDDLIGGSLTSLDETIQYGAFATTGQEGAYTMQLSWASINQAEALTFHKTTTRSFRAVFYDTAGHRVNKDIQLSLTCSENACDGQCSGYCVAESNERKSCDAICAARGRQQCRPKDNRPYFCFGNGNCTISKNMQSCTAVPPATVDLLPFFASSCSCIPT